MSTLTHGELSIIKVYFKPLCKMNSERKGVMMFEPKTVLLAIPKPKCIRDSSPFCYLHEQIGQRVPELITSLYHISYVDRLEGGEMRIETAIDLNTILLCTISLPLRYHTFTVRQKELFTNNTEFQIKYGEELNIKHFGLTCDGCNQQIFGCRYICFDCPDYDLCEKCHGIGLHHEHSMLATWKQTKRADIKHSMLDRFESCDNENSSLLNSFSSMMFPYIMKNADKNEMRHECQECSCMCSKRSVSTNTADQQDESLKQQSPRVTIIENTPEHSNNSSTSSLITSNDYAEAISPDDSNAQKQDWIVIETKQ